jgi:YD repeat-containing protein
LVRPLSYGDSSNSYSGLDQYGRVKNQLWMKTAGGDPVDGYQYGYDNTGNVQWKQNVGEYASGLDERYAYDHLFRLIGTDRGQMNGSHEIPSPAFGQDWTLDGMGNFVDFDNGTVHQDRQHNAANEIQSTTIGETTTPLTYDDAGNLTDDGRLRYTYDAWNRQVRVVCDSGSSVLAFYTFDGLGRRITKVMGDGPKTDYYYNENWQVLEERHANTSGTVTATDQYVWDLSYVDTPVVRFHSGNANVDSDYDDAEDNVLYYTTDANHNVTGLFDAATGNVVERYVYDSYGRVTFRGGDWSLLTSEGVNTALAPGVSYAKGNEILYCGYPRVSFVTVSRKLFAAR